MEALRNRWGGEGPEALHQIAVDLRGGKKLRFQNGYVPSAYRNGSNRTKTKGENAARAGADIRCDVGIGNNR